MPPAAVAVATGRGQLPVHVCLCGALPRGRLGRGTLRARGGALRVRLLHSLHHAAVRGERSCLATQDGCSLAVTRAGPVRPGLLGLPLPLRGAAPAPGGSPRALRAVLAAADDRQQPGNADGHGRPALRGGPDARLRLGPRWSSSACWMCSKRSPPRPAPPWKRPCAPSSPAAGCWARTAAIRSSPGCARTPSSQTCAAAWSAGGSGCGSLRFPDALRLLFANLAELRARYVAASDLRDDTGESPMAARECRFQAKRWL